MIEKKKTKGIAIGLFLVALVFFAAAPVSYSSSFCLSIVLIFILSATFLVKTSLIGSNYFNFHLFFSVSFLFTNFLYPAFIYPLNPTYFPVFKRAFDHDLINKCTALAFLGYASYLVAVVFSRQKTDYTQNTNEEKSMNGTIFWYGVLVSILFLGILYFGGTDMLRGKFQSTEEIPSGLFVSFQVLVGTAMVLILASSYRPRRLVDVFEYLSKPAFLVAVLYFVIFLRVGDRGPIIQLILVIFGSYSILVRPISFKLITIIILVGMVVLTFLSYARSADSDGSLISRGIENTQVSSVFDLGMDLIVNNRNLYVGVEYAKLYGLDYGKGTIHYILGPIPFLPSALTNFFFDSIPGDLTSAVKITDFSNAHYGLGSNLIADLYMQFGTLGVVFFMSLLGLVSDKLMYRAHGKQTIDLLAYVFLLSFSIYLPRTSMFEPIRHIVWSVLFFSIIIGFSRSFTRILKQNIGK